MFARIYERICACMTVSQREIRTAVRECACCRLERPSPETIVFSGQICSYIYSTDIVFLCRFSVWGVFPRRFRLVWQTVFLRFRFHRFVPFSIRKSVCVTDQLKAVTRRFLSLQKTSFTHAQILQTKTAFAETLFRQEPIRFTQFYMS